ncbi:hypothetical protein PC117_g22358 [Phytophthora cactorum]|uniref:DDE Tnp4 domain-containing protein n=1 Tax=Phytophthora cactorum TaxID=29920 RepID=A0A8T1B9B0_9STRA|nr:hypothetical protein PC117_g22358 [Phytophthora cactorum]
MEEFERLEHARLVWIRHYLTAPSLLKPDVAPWTYIWLFGPDKNLLNVTDLSRSLFDWLLQRFALYYNIPRFRSRGGQPRKLESHHEVLGLVMAFYVGSMQHKSLCTTFGVPTSTLSRVLSGAEEGSVEAQCNRSQLPPFTWGFIDGKNYRVQEPPHRDLKMLCIMDGCTQCL